ncbi:glutamine synthetase cytosolic isozyme 1-1 [Tanacetum coccineum]|uniref:Glutamate--ammonia ligase n=1 Tax=Tanacetum coccineum TaxID=301880 RepID=A0ABQ5CEC4_9ASTR
MKEIKSQKNVDDVLEVKNRPSVGIASGDELWAARYIVEIAEVVVSFYPKHIPVDWNDVRAHTNYSTKSMREEGGYEIIKKAIEKLCLRHKEHIVAYGEGNERRLTGRHETADINTFKWIEMALELTYT